MAQDAAQDLHQLLLGDGKAAGLAGQIQIPADLRHGLHKLFVKLRLALLEADEDVFLHRHIREEQRLLRDHVDPLRQRHGGAAERQRLAPDGQLAAVVGVNTHHDLHQRGFSRAVAADQSQHLARHHVQADALEDRVESEGLINVPDREQRPRAARGFFHCHQLLPHSPFMTNVMQKTQMFLSPDFCFQSYHKAFSRICQPPSLLSPPAEPALFDEKTGKSGTFLTPSVSCAQFPPKSLLGMTILRFCMVFRRFHLTRR